MNGRDITNCKKYMYIMQDIHVIRVDIIMPWIDVSWSLVLLFYAMIHA